MPVAGRRPSTAEGDDVGTEGHLFLGDVWMGAVPPPSRSLLRGLSDKKLRLGVDFWCDYYIMVE